MFGAKLVNLSGFDQVQQQLRRFGREFVWVALGMTVSAVGSIVGVRMMTGALSPDQYGVLSLAQTITTLTLLVILSPLAGAILRFFASANETQQLRSYLRAVKRLVKESVVVVLAVAILSLIVAGALGQWTLMGLLCAAFVYSLLLGCVGVLNAMQNAARQRVIVAWHDGLGTWLRYLCGVILVQAVAPTSLVALMGFILASCIVLGSQWYFFRTGILKSATGANGEPNTEQRWRTSIAKYAWPFAVWGIFTWLQASSDRWVLQYFGTTDLVGLYTALFQLSVYPIVLLTGLFMQLITPILFNVAGDGSNFERTHRARWFVIRCTGLTVVATILAIFISWFSNSWFFSMMVAPEYRFVSPFMPWMILGAGIFAAGQVASLNLMIGNKSDRLILPKVSTAIIGVLLNIAGGYLWGLSGVIAAGIMFSLFWFLWMVVLLLQPRSHDDRYATASVS